MVKHCVILVAGRNSRLDTGKPKSLLEINGVSLLERHIQLFSKEGCDNFCIVTGHNPEPIKEKVEELKKRYEVAINIAHNDRYDLENGFSISVVQNWVKSINSEGFFLTMGDHVFDSLFISSFQKDITKRDGKEALCLAVDTPSELNRHIDIEDVTKVLIQETGYIEQIGKGIAKFNRYDTGLFYMKPDVFESLNKCFAQGKYTISDLVTSLIQEYNATTIDVTGYLWNDVDNHSDLDITRKLYS
ncbi:phosphocholine cytidylyltransferase family protein [Reichenbachiella ulvae]|uniref:NTP transferase domain-containing protein n=1 Tax=Reichenbachiella ulvae TaxID=2980104 RepID=A0ABT3CU77_9BACT|nr:NTP transferase domain-containing protein [Reichenbachiella ulvae]MCV9387252.1 NTP transferase domain-containing protein [Reichenbachiella ulvae]